MTGRPTREAVMTALLSTLAGAVQTTFTADTANGSPTLSNPSTTNVFLGLPVFGPGIQRGAVVSALSPLTMSLPATADGTAVALSTGFLTVGRRANFEADVEQPALFIRAPMNRPAEDISYQGILEVLTLDVDLIISSRSGENPDVVPEIALNNFLDAIRLALSPDSPLEGRFTLGGLVHWCRMVGPVHKDNGDLGPLAVAVAGIEITVP